jgi:aromatic-L-amino-acid decarboxylase
MNAAPLPPDSPADLPSSEFRAAAHRVADRIADYLEGVERYPVMPALAPGAVRSSLPDAPPERAEPILEILDDYQRLIEPNVTHWNHPRFFAYFASSGSGPGILAEALTAALNVNAMLWRSAPAATELEELVCDWLRQMLGLGAEWRGQIHDTASISSLYALAAARHRLRGLEIRRLGMAGRPELPRLVVYVSEQAHSSIDKAAIALGFGLDNVRHLALDAQFRMDVSALERALVRDRDEGRLPLAVVATAGTTSTTAIDPIRPLADICGREGLWLHVDAAYAGSAAICPEHRAVFDGWQLADSIVVNPHKWLFTPLDCSVLLLRDPEALQDAFSLVPEYLRTTDQGVTNLMDWGVQLGRRFRALKLWMVIRAFGVSGLQERIRAHCALAREFASWVRADPGFELCAPVPFGTVCFRATPPLAAEEQDRLNEQLLAELNARGHVFLSHTRLEGRMVLRLAIGNIRTRREHVTQAWDQIRTLAAELLDRP